MRMPPLDGGSVQRGPLDLDSHSGEATLTSRLPPRTFCLAEGLMKTTAHSQLLVVLQHSSNCPRGIPLCGETPLAGRRGRSHRERQRPHKTSTVEADGATIHCELSNGDCNKQTPARSQKESELYDVYAKQKVDGSGPGPA